MKHKIGVDVSDLCTNRADGTTRYTKELWQRLPQLAPQYDWQWFAPCKQPPGNNAGRWQYSPWPRFWTQLRFPEALYRQQPDLLFMPIQQIPIFRPGRMKVIATVHDLAFHYFPEQFRYKDWALLHLFTAHAVRVADHLVADSQATAADIARQYGRTENISVVHLGIDHAKFYLPTLAEKEAAAKKINQKYPVLNSPYILFVGQIQPRKNLTRLVDAFAKVKSEQPELNLVLVGREGWLQQPILDHLKKSQVSDSIIHLTDVSDDLLPALYWQAKLFALPSLYEGFGLPILEAMACGTPVLTSSVSSLPEVAGEGAVLCDPHSTASITTGLFEALAREEELKQKGLEQAQKFNWEKTLQNLAKIFQEYV